MKPALSAKLKNLPSDRALLLNPHLTQMPLPMQILDDPFLPFGKTIMNATRDLLGAYVFDLGAYLALGAAGAVALERTVAYAVDTLTILHGAFVGSGYVEAAQAFGVDGVTLAYEADFAAYLAAGLLVFLWSDIDQRILCTLDGKLNLRLCREDVLYAGRGDDFAERARAALQGKQA